MEIELNKLGEQIVRRIIQEERQRILAAIQAIEDQSHATKTPIYQETLFSKVREIVNAN